MDSEELINSKILQKNLIDKLIKNQNFDELKNQIEKLKEQNKILLKENKLYNNTKILSNNLFNDYEKIIIKYIEKDEELKTISQKELYIKDKEDLMNFFSDVHLNIDNKNSETKNDIIKSIQSSLTTFKYCFDKEKFKKNNSREMFLAVKNFYRTLTEAQEVILENQEKIIHLRSKNEKLTSKIKNKLFQKKNSLSRKMREITLKQILLNYLRKEEMSLKYNFKRFLMSTDTKKSKEKLIQFYLNSILQRKEEKNKFFLKKYFMKFYLGGIIKELNMSKKEQKELEKLREERRMKSFEERNRIDELTNQERIRKRYLKDLISKRIKKKIDFIHQNFIKLYYRGVYLKMKYGDKAGEILGLISNKKEELKNKESENSINKEIEIQKKEENKINVSKEIKLENNEKKKLEKENKNNVSKEIKLENNEEKKLEKENKINVSEENKLENQEEKKSEKENKKDQRKKAMELRKKLKEEKAKRKEEESKKKEEVENKKSINNQQEIIITNEEEEIKEERPKIIMGARILVFPTEKETIKLGRELIGRMLKEQQIRFLTINKTMSKYIYRRERVEMGIKKKILVQWNYRVKLLTMKKSKIIKKKKKKNKKNLEKLKTNISSTSNFPIEQEITLQSPIIEYSPNNNNEESIILKGSASIIKFPTESTIKMGEKDEEENNSENEDDYEIIDLNNEIRKHSILSSVFKKKKDNLIKNHLFKWYNLTFIKRNNSIKMAKKIFILSLVELIGHKLERKVYIFKRYFFNYLKQLLSKKNV